MKSPRAIREKELVRIVVAQTSNGKDLYGQNDCPHVKAVLYAGSSRRRLLRFQSCGKPGTMS